MTRTRRPHPVEALRSLAASLGSAATREAASAAVRGAAEGLREQLPELDASVRALVEEALAVAERVVHAAAERQQAPGSFTHDVAAAAASGALERLEAEWQNGGMPFHGLLVRLEHLVERVSAVAASRDQELRMPGERARRMAQGMVDGALDRLHDGMPQLTGDLKALAPAGGAVAYEVGRELARGLESRAAESSEALALALERAGEGLVHGLARGLGQELRALGARLGRPAAWAAGTTALLAAALLTARRRHA